MRKLLNLLFSRLAIVGLLIVIQALTLIMIIWKLSSYFVYLYALFTIISLFVVLWLINTNENPAYKLAWTVPILIFPVFGGLFYLFFGGKKMNKRLEKKSESVEEYSLGILEQDNDILDLLWSKDKNIASQARYIYHSSDFPIYENTQTMYLSPGEVKYQKLLEELKKAQHFIFLEYFIIAEGIMWDSILEILKEKVADGVDVRVMYDDCGCLQTLPYHYDEKLRSMGIKCLVFNPFRPNLSVRMNNRDHRKIAVIDGYVGFTGGVNLADEYINAQERFGHWKDASIMLKGEAVWNL
ncbi:MAG: PLDc N-terminal domain-containing protein, partial [Clostridiales bacterium]